MNANIVATLLLVSGAKSSRVLSHTGRARVKHCQRTFDFCHQEDDLDDIRNEDRVQVYIKLLYRNTSRLPFKKSCEHCLT